MSAEYEVTPEAARGDVDSFLQTLAERGLLAGRADCRGAAAMSVAERELRGEFSATAGASGARAGGCRPTAHRAHPPLPARLRPLLQQPPGRRRRRARRRELDTSELRRIIDEIAEAGCLWLLLTGGEIFARKDFLDIYIHAKQRGLFVSLFTNGTQVTPAIADYLAVWRPFAIEVTLYGRTRETYERLTGVPGSFDRCMRGIQLLKERGLPLKLKTVAVTINRHEIAGMQRFAEEELGLPFKFDGMINARIDCSGSPLAVRLAAREMVALDVGDPVRRSRVGEPRARAARARQRRSRDDLYQLRQRHQRLRDRSRGEADHLRPVQERYVRSA